MSIEKATRTDIPALEALVNSAYRGESSKKGWTTEADLLGGTRTDADMLDGMISKKNGVMLKYTDDTGYLAGCVYLEKQDAKLYLGMLTVSPEIQGLGIGKKLLQASEDHARQVQCTGIFMTVISVRVELIAWYERHGYHKTGEVRPFPVGAKFGVANQPLEFIVLENHLAQTGNVSDT